MSIASEDVLDFWFGELDEDGLATEEVAARWWVKDDAFDREIRDRFGAVHAAIHADQLEGWLSMPRSRLSYLIVLDQFSRNMFRGTAKMFASDERALSAALDGVERGHDRQLLGQARSFLYMPLMHSEDLAIQDRCVALFEAFAGELGGSAWKSIANNVLFAKKHRDIVVRFGRFPHRNAILGRQSTPEEAKFLMQPGSSF